MLPRDWGKKALVVAGSLAVTGLLLTLSLSLGSWGYRHRQASLHAGRLQRLKELHPTAARVQAGLEAEGARLAGQSSTPAELLLLARRWAPSAPDLVLAKGRPAARTRVFLVGEMVYFLFFDADDRLIDYVNAERP
jgi:hypothetical protein